MRALEKQIGGTHYKSSYQPIAFIIKQNLNFIQGNIVKYVTRRKYKNGKEDLEKCLHYCELAEELKPTNYAVAEFSELHKYTNANSLNEIEHNIIACVILSDWKKTKELLTTLITLCYAD